MEDLPVIVEVVLSPGQRERLPTGRPEALEMLDREVRRFATAIKEEQDHPAKEKRPRGD